MNNKDALERLATEVAETVFYHVSEGWHKERLKTALIMFANEIQRRSIEP